MKKLLCAGLLLLAAGHALAGDGLSSGQALYLPVYSKIWYGNLSKDEKVPYDTLLSVLVSIRNTSLLTPITVTSARYYSTDGQLLKEYLAKPAVVKAMGTLELYVERQESEGGSGANFVVQWKSATPTNPPIVEAVHADIRNGQHSIVFTTEATPIRADR